MAELKFIGNEQPEIGRYIKCLFSNSSLVKGIHTGEEPEHTKMTYWRYLTDEEIEKLKLN